MHALSFDLMSGWARENRESWRGELEISLSAARAELQLQVWPAAALDAGPPEHPQLIGAHDMQAAGQQRPSLPNTQGCLCTLLTLENPRHSDQNSACAEQQTPQGSTRKPPQRDGFQRFCAHGHSRWYQCYSRVVLSRCTGHCSPVLSPLPGTPWSKCSSRGHRCPTLRGGGQNPGQLREHNLQVAEVAGGRGPLLRSMIWGQNNR